MNATHIDTALGQVDRLRTLLKKGNGEQVRGTEERSIVKATGLSWFHNHKTNLEKVADTAPFKRLDDGFHKLVAYSDRLCTRKVYDRLLKAIRTDLIALRVDVLSAPTPTAHTSDQPISFQRLGSDQRMQDVLAARWNECVICLEAGAPLAATVMMGGLLEALLLARVNLEADKSAVFKAAAAPKDDQKKSKALKEWALKNYIEVAHELGWITVSAKDVGEVLRDYRNYIHPSKQYSHNIALTTEDAAVLWEVAKAISRQVLKLSSS
jgi:hypothetical protein